MSILLLSCRCFFSGRTFHAADDCPEHGNARNIAHCDACGTSEHIHLLDSKPEPGVDPETADYTRLECIACYGPEWLPCAEEHVGLSIRSDLAWHYHAWTLRGIVWA
jgi:hypothetical protein